MQYIVQEMPGINNKNPWGKAEEAVALVFHLCQTYIFGWGGGVAEAASFSILMMVNCRGSAENKAEADHQ